MSFCLFFPFAITLMFCRASYGLDFVVPFGVFLQPLYFLQISSWTRRLDEIPVWLSGRQLQGMGGVPPPGAPNAWWSSVASIPESFWGCSLAALQFCDSVFM